MKIEFRVTPEQYAFISRVAAEQGMSPGQYARFSALQSANMSAILADLAFIKAELPTIIPTLKSAIANVPAAIVEYRNKLAANQGRA